MGAAACGAAALCFPDVVTSILMSISFCERSGGVPSQGARDISFPEVMRGRRKLQKDSQKDFADRGGALFLLFRILARPVRRGQHAGVGGLAGQPEDVGDQLADLLRG